MTTPAENFALALDAYDSFEYFELYPVETLEELVPTTVEKDTVVSLLTRLQSLRDAEQAHRLADLLLLRFINDPKVTEAFEAIFKWYA